MGSIIGIDLGTTSSIVTIPEERTGDGFMMVSECPGFSVILDRLGRAITPSVVAEDDSGNIVVGYRAKGRAGLSPEPIMFAKRWMGEEKTFQLNKQGSLQPVEVSAHILRYLKTMAEERLGETVHEAVITVPAYFSLKARQMTEKAGEMARLKVAQIAPEPVAAALMYCMGDTRDPLRIMTYDLGGGTFDVAILEKRDGMISTNSIRAFDGDRFLGGYNFDQTLALWIMDQLNTNGYDLRLNLESPADRVIFAKLMVYAEKAKIALSKEESYEIEEPTTGITDHMGNQVAIYLGITRQRFEEMIGEQIEHTLQLCCRAMMEKAQPPISADEIDEIVMIGGSSRIPMIARRLKEEFGKTPKLVRPDLCIALGAAIIAGTKAQTFGSLKLDAIPTETDMPSLVVTGRVIPSDELQSVQGCVVSLKAMDGAYQSSRTTEPEGTFVFDEVPLVPEETTDFTLSVNSPAGPSLATHRFSVAQTEASTRRHLLAVTNVLSKSISIATVEGVHEIAPERTPLPYETIMHIKTMDNSGEIRVLILEENSPLGEIVMKDIPANLAVGSALEITLIVEENYQIRARSYVPALGCEATVIIDIPVRPQKSIEELRREFELLQARSDDTLAAASRGARFGDANVKRLKDRMKYCQELLRSRLADPAAIQASLDEVESLVRDLSSGWRPDPPRSIFEQKADQAQELLAMAIREQPKVADVGYDRQLTAIHSEAERAFTAQNNAAWKDSVSKLDSLCGRLQGIVKKSSGREQPQDPGTLLLILARELIALEDLAKGEGLYPRFESEFRDAAAELKRIGPEAGDAMNQIRDWYLTRYDNLRRRIEQPAVGGLVGSLDSNYLPNYGRNSPYQSTTGSEMSVAGQLDTGVTDSDVGQGQKEETHQSGLLTRSGKPEVPGGNIDRVHFSVTSPPILLPGTSFVIDVWAHLESQRERVIQQAREAIGGGEITIKSKGPMKVTRGTVLVVRLKLDELIVEEPEDVILWEGEIGNATFLINAPERVAEGPKRGQATIHIDGLRIARIDFVVQIGSRPLPVEQIPIHLARHHTAFVSYASQDRDEVLPRIQGIQKAVQGLEVFMDVLSLRSGQDWGEQLWTMIPSRDVFYLFWSENAKKSEWVEKEWRCALQTRGIDFIDPVPLAPPDEVPPPPELASKHFNDWVLAFISRKKS